ncbi:hypothetical protein CB1_001111001 [Camelus ferus]|nr:hypothetical protein CB1_001111001 [Camelus ferus]
MMKSPAQENRKRDFEPLPPAVFGSQDLVVLKRNLNSQDENPCFLYLRCDPGGGSRIDLERVQTIMESMGSKLSPGAQQLMNMVRFQQQVLSNSENEMLSPDLSHQNCVPIGEQLQTGLTSGNVTEDFKASVDKSAQPAGGGAITNLQECKIVPQNHSLLENDLKKAVSSFLPKKASDSSHIPNSELLPLLQNLCSQVSHLRVGPTSKWQEGITAPAEGTAGVTMEEQPVCFYLEKILSKNMELMEKKLTDYIDQQIYKLQEHIDNKIALLMDLLQHPNSPPSGMPLRHYDSGERLSNGER